MHLIRNAVDHGVELPEARQKSGKSPAATIRLAATQTLVTPEGTSLTRALTMATVGLLLGVIGIDAMSGYTRFSYAIIELSDGIGIVPVAVGMFGLSEILLTPGQATPPPVQRPTLRQLVPSGDEMRLSVGPIARGSLIGFLIGIIPGSAHIISSFVSYGIERRMSAHPERFGNGAIEGVAGPESANNSAATGAFVRAFNEPGNIRQDKFVVAT